MVSHELIEWTKEKINENCGQIEATHEVIRIRCPFCGDSKKKSNKKRGNYYLKDGMFKCFNGDCQKFTDSYNLVAELECRSYSEVKADFFKYERGGGGNFEFIDTFEPREIVTIADDFVIPSNWMDISEKPKHYVDERLIGLAPNLTKEWQLYFNTDNNRLVIPWIKNGKIVYYQERAIYKDQIPKYLFPKDTMDRPVFGIDNIREDYPWIFYLEGALDSIWVINGVATGSITLSAVQKEMLSNFFGHKLVYFPDNPWLDKASRENIIKLSEKQKDLLVWMWPKSFKQKDVNELVCSIGKSAKDFFYTTELHQNVVSIQRARCMLELM